MTMMQPSVRRTPRVELDDEPTTFDCRPWHLAARARTEDSVTEVRPPRHPIPRPRMRSGVEPSERHVVEHVDPPRPAPAPVVALAVRRAPSPASRVSEKVELLSLPSGLREDMLPEGARPQDHDQVHIAIVRVARQLGREYRERRGSLLRTDAAAIEILQRHLTYCATEVLAGRMDTRALAPELARHGALFGEILARRLGGTWVDLTVAQPSQWQMAFPGGEVVSPIARVHRFLLLRNREQDLVGFFLDLDAASRRSA